MISIQPDFVDAWIYRGRALQEMGEYQEALTSFKHALEIDPGRKEVWEDIGGVLDTIGKHEEAKICYKKAG
jgi:tetratricopeptide (TPR) repeat protein